MILDIVEISEASRIAGVSTGTLRRAADEGRLRHIKTTNGRRLFQRKDIQKFKEARDKRKTA